MSDLRHGKDPYSFAVCKIDLLFNDTPCATGSGFLMAVGDRDFLITASHNLSGENLLTKGNLSPTGCRPNRVELRFADSEDVVRVQIKDDAENPTWLTPGCSDRYFDVGIVDVTGRFPPERIIGRFDPRPDHPQRILLTITERIFVVGFPRGISVQGYPIWKQAKIASEPSLNIDPDQEKGKSLPAFLVDSATMEGLTGGLAILRTHDPLVETDSGASERNFWHGGWHYKVAGVYSGRVGSENIERARLGIVWRMDEIIEFLGQ